VRSKIRRQRVPAETKGASRQRVPEKQRRCINVGKVYPGLSTSSFLFPLFHNGHRQQPALEGSQLCQCSRESSSHTSLKRVGWASAAEIGWASAAETRIPEPGSHTPMLANHHFTSATIGNRPNHLAKCGPSFGQMWPAPING